MAKIDLYGADWCPDCTRAKNYLDTNNVAYNYIDLQKVEDAAAVVEKINNGKRVIPTIIIDDVPYTNPNNSVLKEVLGL